MESSVWHHLDTPLGVVDRLVLVGMVLVESSHRTICYQLRRHHEGLGMHHSLEGSLCWYLVDHPLEMDLGLPDGPIVVKGSVVHRATIRFWILCTPSLRSQKAIGSTTPAM